MPGAAARSAFALVEQSTGEILFGPPKSKAGRIVSIPQAILPTLREHMSIFVKPEPGSLVFPVAMGGPLRRSNFNKAFRLAVCGEVDRRGRSTRS